MRSPRPLDRLPAIADELADVREAALRDLFESLDLKISYHPGDRALDIQVTLADPVGSDAENGRSANDPAG